MVTIIESVSVSAMLDAVRAERVQVEQQRAKLDQRLATLKQREQTLVAWLDEDRPSQPELPISEGNGGTPLSSFLQGLLSDGKPRTSAQIAELAEKRGLIGENKSPGRVVHFALVGLAQHGYVERDETKGTWRTSK